MHVSLPNDSFYRWGRFTLDPGRRSLCCDGETVKVSERLFDVLHYLVANCDRVVGRTDLLETVWGGRIVDDNNVSQAIFEVRKILKAGGGTDRSIVTIPGKGFRFVEPVTARPVSRGLVDAEQPTRLNWRRSHLALAAALLALVIAGFSLAIWTVRTPVPTSRHTADRAFSPPAHSVAVLAFDNLSGEPGQSYLSDGLSEQLIDSLTQIKQLRVAARISAFSFRGGHATIDQIAHALNVGAILAGSVRRTGSRVAVTAQLTDALTGFNIWSRTYNRDQKEMITVQSDIALAVARSMRLLPLEADQIRLTLGGTSNAAAFDAYLRGMNFRRNARALADYQAALAEFDRALTIDPGFALAHAKRAITLVAIQALGTSSTPAEQHLVQDATAAADRAVALAPMSGAAHSARGAVLGHLLLDKRGAFDEQAKAIALAPGNASIESNYASAALALGRVGEAVAAARRAAELDPLDPNFWGQMGQVFYEGHRYREALEALDRERAVAGTLPLRHRVLNALVLLMTGQAQAARTMCSSGSDWQENQLLALADHALGHQAAAEADLTRVQAALGDDAASNYAEIYAQWGMKAEALRWFDKAVRTRSPGLLDVRLDPLLDPIRGEPQFKVSLARLDQS